MYIFFVWIWCHLVIYLAVCGDVIVITIYYILDFYGFAFRWSNLYRYWHQPQRQKHCTFQENYVTCDTITHLPSFVLYGYILHWFVLFFCFSCHCILSLGCLLQAITQLKTIDYESDVVELVVACFHWIWLYLILLWTTPIQLLRHPFSLSYYISHLYQIATWNAL